MNICKKPHSFLLTGATLASDNPLHFRKYGKNIKTNHDNWW